MSKFKSPAGDLSLFATAVAECPCRAGVTFACAKVTKTQLRVNPYLSRLPSGSLNKKIKSRLIFNTWDVYFIFLFRSHRLGMLVGRFW
jgi:hypothetical protein